MVGLLIITVLAPSPTKASATALPANFETLASETIDDMQGRQRDVAALDARYTRNSLMRKLKMMLFGASDTMVVGCRQRKMPVCHQPGNLQRLRHGQ